VPQCPIAGDANDQQRSFHRTVAQSGTCYENNKALLSTSSRAKSSTLLYRCYYPTCLPVRCTYDERGTWLSFLCGCVLRSTSLLLFAVPAESILLVCCLHHPYDVSVNHLRLRWLSDCCHVQNKYTYTLNEAPIKSNLLQTYRFGWTRCSKNNVIVVFLFSVQFSVIYYGLQDCIYL